MASKCAKRGKGNMVIKSLMCVLFGLCFVTLAACEGGGGDGDGGSEDSTVPVITLQGANSLNLSAGDIFTDPGATASDNVDGNISSIVVAGDTVNTAAPGSYVVTYDTSDAAGNPAAGNANSHCIGYHSARYYPAWRESTEPLGRRHVHRPRCNCIG